MLEAFLDALADSLKTLPFLFGAYLLIEYLEHRAGGRITGILSKMGHWGPLGGAVLGCVPQCGFSVAASNFYAGRVITMGTLVAVFLSTSDEAVPILLAHPEQISALWPILLIKIILAVAVGFLTDAVYRVVTKGRQEEPFHEICEDCDCEEEGIFKAALHHTVRIFLFLLLVNVVLGMGIFFIGQETIAKLTLSGSVFQPFITALIGFIPNCAASVVLTELYVAGNLSFGSLIAGLSTGAGIGLAVLFRINKKHLGQNFIILGILYAASVAAGLLLNAFWR